MSMMESAAAARESPPRRLGKLKARPYKRVTDHVAQQQRLRLYQAMIDAVGEHGYSGTNVRDLCARAGVSSKTLYLEFGDKEKCFLATFDVIAGRAAYRVKQAWLDEKHWTKQLYAAFAAFAREVVSEPAAAQLALVDVLGAGPAALLRMEQASRRFESLIQASFRAAPDGVDVPPVIARGIVGGISRVTRQLLLEHRENELPALADT